MMYFDINYFISKFLTYCRR